MYPKHANLLWKYWYPALTRLTRNSPVNFLNYGFADNGTVCPLLQEADESDRACIQLYYRVTKAVDLHDQNVLEVSCGHGGGASYIARYMKPKSMHGVDRNAKAIELCRRRHQVEGLIFSCGNALALDFAYNTFDAVVNIEASHCYPDVPRFFREVHRVLRPGGHFLYADFRDRVPDCGVLAGQIEKSGLELVTYDDISPNVVLGIQQNNDRYMALIQRLVPRLLWKPAMRFAGVKESAIYKGLESGETVYLCYQLRKPVKL